MAHRKRPGKRQVFTTHIKLRNGKVLQASSVGKRVFVFWVDDKKPR